MKTRVFNVHVYGVKDSIIRYSNNLSLHEYTGKTRYNKDELLYIDKQNKKGRLNNTPLSGIIVNFDIVVPIFVLLDMVGKINIIQVQNVRHVFRYDEYDELVTSATKDHITKLIAVLDNYNDVKEVIIDNKKVNNESEFKSLIVANLPLGFNVFVSISTNYLELQEFYRYAKSRSLSPYWVEIKKFVEGLPLSWLITRVNSDNSEEISNTNYNKINTNDKERLDYNIQP